MTRSKRLQVVIDVNADNEQQALKELGRIQVQKKTMQEQLDNLQQYSEEYTLKYQAMGESGISVQQLLEFRAFMGKLDQAVTAQVQMISDLDTDISKARDYWQTLHQKKCNLNTVFQLAQYGERRRANRREQTEQDNRSGRLKRKRV